MHFPGNDFDRVTPEQAGISSSAITTALRTIEKDGKDIHSMLILRDGQLAYEHYFAPYTRDTAHAMYSCSKTFTSMLIGIAQGKGLLSLSDKVLSYFPEVKIDAPTEFLERMTLRDLLAMGSGHSEDTFGNMMDAEDGDFARVFLNQAVDHEPGTYFVYNTGATYMLSAVLTKVTGINTFDLAKEWLLDDIGATPDRWECCPKGIAMGGTGLYVKPTDMARLGLLISNGGEWNGRQIIPADYVAEAQKKQIDNSHHSVNANWSCGYCYQMWRCSFGAFRADGMGGQFIVMLPEKKLVFVFTSALGSDIGYPLDIVRDILLPGCVDEPLPEDAAHYDELLLESDRTLVPGGIVYGRYIIEGENEIGFKAITFGENEIILENKDLCANLPYAWNGYRKSGEEYDFMSFNKRIIATEARMRRGKPEFRFNAFSEPMSMIVRPEFADGKVSIYMKHSLEDNPASFTGVKE